MDPGSDNLSFRTTKIQTVQTKSIHRGIDSHQDRQSLERYPHLDLDSRMGDQNVKPSLQPNHKCL